MTNPKAARVLGVLTPQYAHDCATCVFHGHVMGFDIYICRGEKAVLGGSIIARHGSEGGAYASVPLMLLPEVLAQLAREEPAEDVPYVRAWELVLADMQVAALLQRGE